MEMSIKGKTSLNSLVVIWSKTQVDGLEAIIAVVSSERSTGQKPSQYKSGSKDTSKAAVLDDISLIIVGRIPLIFSLIETILLVELMKSLLLRVKGIDIQTIACNTLLMFSRNDYNCM